MYFHIFGPITMVEDLRVYWRHLHTIMTFYGSMTIAFFILATPGRGAT